jgi:hypothetical protein
MSSTHGERRPVVVVMLGGVGGSPLEEQFRAALEASALDTIEAALGTGCFARALLLADRAPASSIPAGATVDVDAGPFQFGRRLTDTVAHEGIERLVYLGAGSGPLLAAAEFEALRQLPEGAAVCVTNNAFSADCFALAPASELAHLEPLPHSDNLVPRRLREERGIEVRTLPHGIATQLNLDTPGDLVALALTGHGGPRLQALLAQWHLDTSRLERAASVLTDRHAEVLVAGRVGSHTWRYLESETACRVRLLAEERGMTAAGRDTDGTARSLLGQLLASVGPGRFFGELLPELCDAAFIDVRPALVQLGLHPSRADRFAADLGAADAIEDPGLRALVQAANASPVPVVLGGHSLVAGVLMLVNDWAWARAEQG